MSFSPFVMRRVYDRNFCLSFMSDCVRWLVCVCTCIDIELILILFMLLIQFQMLSKNTFSCLSGHFLSFDIQCFSADFFLVRFSYPFISREQNKKKIYYIETAYLFVARFDCFHSSNQ